MPESKGRANNEEKTRLHQRMNNVELELELELEHKLELELVCRELMFRVFGAEYEKVCVLLVTK